MSPLIGWVQQNALISLSFIGYGDGVPPPGKLKPWFPLGKLSSQRLIIKFLPI